MSGSHIPHGLMVIFSITTMVVFLYPIIKLTPLWLERSMAKKIIFHRDAMAAIGTAMERSHNDADQFARLQAQHDYHRAALNAVAPGEAAAQAAGAEREAA
jgi:hypothetical protein